MTLIKKSIGYLREFARSAAPITWRIRGKEQLTGKRLALLYSGADSQKGYFIDRIFAGDFEIERVGRTWIGDIERTARRLNCDLSINTLRQELRFVAEKPGVFYVPLWIGATVDLRRFDTRPKPSTLKADLRRIKRHGLTCIASRDSKSIMKFYDTMYLDYVGKRYGDTAIVPRREIVEKRAEAGNLEFFSIYHGRELIGGSVVDRKSSLPRLYILAAASADTDVLNTGVMSATYIFAIRNLIEQGESYFDLGLNRPFIRDGVLQYKRKLGARLHKATNMGALVQPISRNDAVRSFLAANPFITCERSGLWLLTFPTPDGNVLCDATNWLYHGQLLEGLAGIRENRFPG